MLCTEQSHCNGPLAVGARSPASENTPSLTVFFFLSKQTKYGYGKQGRLSAHFGRKAWCNQVHPCQPLSPPGWKAEHAHTGSPSLLPLQNHPWIITEEAPRGTGYHDPPPVRLVQLN